MKNTYQLYRLGKESLMGLTVVGAVMMIIGGLFIYHEQMWSMIGVIFVGLAIVLSHSGLMIDPVNRRMKRYTWILFAKVGSWVSLEDYPDIVVLRKKKKTGLNYNGMPTNQSLAYVDFEVYLASANHYEREVICRKHDQKAAYAEARKLAELLDCEFVRFNPGKRFKRLLL